MPAKSKAQQQMFGIAHAIQQGKRPAGSSSSPATDVAKAAKPKDVKAIASTPTKNLPKKVKKEQIERIREYVTKVVKEVLAEARLNEAGRGITTKMWKDAGEPFEVWLRYSQASSSQKDQVEKLFAKKYPHITENLNEDQNLSVSQGQDGDWWIYGGGVTQDGPFETRGKASAAMVQLKKSLSEAYNRGTARIDINPRNGHIHWRNSQGQYDSDLPVDRGGKRDKGYVQRRVAQIKKQLWGFTITVNDPGGMLKEAGKTWYVNWYEKGKWFEKEFKSEREAGAEMDKQGDRLSALGGKSPNVSYGTDNSIYG